LTISQQTFWIRREVKFEIKKIKPPITWSRDSRKDLKTRLESKKVVSCRLPHEATQGRPPHYKKAPPVHPPLAVARDVVAAASGTVEKRSPSAAPSLPSTTILLLHSYIHVAANLELRWWRPRSSRLFPTRSSLDGAQLKVFHQQLFEVPNWALLWVPVVAARVLSINCE
jgi:hypothetical protein